MNRDDYLMRAHEFTPRGVDLPQSKLTEAQVQEIREAKEKRDDLRKHIKENLSVEAMAVKFGVHPRTIEKAEHYGSWRHVPSGSLFS
jgi:transcriptional regulator GlxA family with amidase domain